MDDRPQADDAHESAPRLHEVLDRLARVEGELAGVRRCHARLRRSGAAILVVGFAFVGLAAAVRVKSADLEIRENPDGGGAGSDSYRLKLVGRVAGPADAAMSLQNVAEPGSDYRLAFLNNGGTELVTIEEGGNVGIGTAIPNPTQMLHMTRANDVAMRFEATGVTGPGAETQGPASPGTLANDASIGTIPWTGPGNAASSDNTYATAAGAGTTQYLKATNFGFSVPGTATIDGILLEVEKRTSSASTPTYVASTTQTSNTASKPGATVADDLMLALLNTEQVPTSVTPPAGWTSIRQVSISAGGIAVLYYKVAGGGEPGNYTWTVSGGGRIETSISTYRGVSTAIPIDAENGVATANGTNHITPSITTNVSDTMIVTVFASDTGGQNNWNPPGGMTERFDGGSGPGWPGEMSADATQASAGPTGSKTATTDSNTTGAAFILALRPVLAVVDASVRIVKGGAISGAEKASASPWPTVDTYTSYGGPADLWGLAWTPADVNSGSFGVAIAATVSGSTASTDHIRITVYYTDSSVGPADWTLGIDWSANGQFKISNSATLGTSDVFILRPTSGLAGLGRVPAANRLEVEGNASKTTAGDWLANSDRRIKKDVARVEDALGQVQKLRPVRFRYTEEYRKKHPSIEDRVYYGFIAQEFAEVFPEAVQGDGEGLLSIDTYAVRPYLVAAIQDLLAIVEAQERRLAIQEREIEELKRGH
ncbi:MAG: tail fiber domain-containing protein [Planctomycetes bacterium]|nr:tail fiber domain-containing protein [Planctomycetota bacterium]